MTSSTYEPNRPTGIASAVAEGADVSPTHAEISGDPDFDLFDANGGLTADALALLSDIDREGGFV